MTAAPPQVRLLTLVPSIWKLLAETRWPLAVICTWFSVWKIELFEPPGPFWFGRSYRSARPAARALAEDARRQPHQLVRVAPELRQLCTSVA